jgi:hypothetical protein
MSASREILRRLSALGARVECRGERVVLCAGKRPVPAELIEAARQAKTELSKVLTVAEDAHVSAFAKHEDFCGSQAGPASKVLTSASLSTFGETEPLGPVWDGAEEERAAIIEHDGGIPRAWAEGFAQLDPHHPPGDVPPRRWQQFVNDVGRFLDSRFCAVAAAFGWTPYDLFGADRNRPFARIDQAGLLWLLNGDKLFALTQETATIERQTGARQTYRRKPSAPGRVLAWELARSG